MAGATATLMVAVMRRGTVSIEGAALAVTTVVLLLVVAFLLAAAGFSFYFCDIHRAFTNRPGSGVAIVLMVLPLAASGVALLREQRESAMG